MGSGQTQRTPPCSLHQIKPQGISMLGDSVKILRKWRALKKQWSVWLEAGKSVLRLFPRLTGPVMSTKRRSFTRGLPSTHVWEPPQGSPSPAPRSLSPLPAGTPPREEEENSGPSVQGFLGRKRRGALESQGYKGACRPGCPTIPWWVIPSIWRMKASGAQSPKTEGDTPPPLRLF